MSNQNEGKGKGKGKAPVAPNEEQNIMSGETWNLDEPVPKLLIYLDVIMEGKYDFAPMPHDWTRGALLKANSRGPNRLALLRLCRQIYQEAMTLPFKYNIFNIGNPMNFQDFTPTFTNQLQVDALTTLAFAVNVNNPVKTRQFMSNVTRLQLRGLRAKAPGLVLVYIHSLQRHWKCAGGDWKSIISAGKGAFQEWERNDILLKFQKFVSSEDMRNIPAAGPSGKGKGKAVPPRPNVKIIFHVVLNDGRHFTKDEFCAEPVQEMEKSEVALIEQECPMAD
ncbi:hypothetical protein IQ07DRAFT_595687 [Pyrenochaeta sp. DS3sAY3a]|nr:hypothetical protein IQ07DRAFT_595687 [Pyrenochaeta sp. DS3sAY3a]